MRCSRSKLRVTNAHGLLVNYTGKKLFKVKFNGMVSLRILHLVMIKGEQTVMMMLMLMLMLMVMMMLMMMLMVMVMMMLMVMYRVPLDAAVLLTSSD